MLRPGGPYRPGPLADALGVLFGVARLADVGDGQRAHGGRGREPFEAVFVFGSLLDYGRGFVQFDAVLEDGAEAKGVQSDGTDGLG